MKKNDLVRYQGKLARIKKIHKDGKLDITLTDLPITYERIRKQSVTKILKK